MYKKNIFKMEIKILKILELNNNMKFKFRIYKVHKMLIIIKLNKKIEKMNKLGY